MNTVTREESERMQIVAENIQRLIDVRGWTWSALADQASVSQPMISRIKNALSEPGIFTMHRIAAVLDTSIDWLCEEHNSKKFTSVS